jgi:hypothetical protein
MVSERVITDGVCVASNARWERVGFDGGRVSVRLSLRREFCSNILVSQLLTPQSVLLLVSQASGP